MNHLAADELRVVYQDAHFLALDKPAGIATTAPDASPNVFAMARELDPRAPRLHPLSRLDTQVSGLLVFARDERTNLQVLAARRAGRLARRYLGLAQHCPDPPSGEWRAAIGLDPRDPRRRIALPAEARAAGVKAAHTRYALRARNAALLALDLWPVTGRTHQLRVHAAHAGVPLLGDVAYGGMRRVTLPNGRILSAGRAMLHCAEVCLPHPDHARGELRLSLAPAEDMQRLWAAAGGAAEALSAADPA